MQTIHINLVSDQLIPNLIPTFSDPACAGVVLVFGDDKLDAKGERLAQIYQDRNIDVLWRSQGKSSFDFMQLKQQARELIDYLSTHHADKHWVLNATCGTKPMSMAMLFMFEKHNAALAKGSDPALIIYTDTQNKAIPLLNDNKDFKLPYKSVLTLKELLAANGFWVTSVIDKDHDDDVKERADLTQYLAKQFAGPCRGMLGRLQAMASEAYKSFSHNKRQKMKEVPMGGIASVYQALVDNEFIHWKPGSTTIEFSSEFACRYLSGLWLEELTYLAALDAGFEEVAMNVEGVWGTQQDQERAYQYGYIEKGQNNEFDVLVRHKNQLLTIECKAKNWFSNGQQVNSQETLLKLDSLGKKLSGLYGKNLLVSACEVTDAMHARAQANRIMMCDKATFSKTKSALEKIKLDLD